MVTRIAHVKTLEGNAIQELGVRAVWLHLQLTGVQALALAPRDRELLAIVATRPYGVPVEALQQRLSATAALDSTAALHWIRRLVDQGWLSIRDDQDSQVVDLAPRDLEWIAGRTNDLATD